MTSTTATDSPSTTNTERYRVARDQMVRLIGDYETAVREFRWPAITGRFNWAIDWFDVIARGNDRTALWLCEQDGTETKVSFERWPRARIGWRPGWPSWASARAIA